jgi:hypothetical protein
LEAFRGGTYKNGNDAKEEEEEEREAAYHLRLDRS